MVDIHSHVLWGMDDGARSNEESLAMLVMAHQHGTTDIVATPHASWRYRFQPNLVRERIEALAAEASISQPRVHSGCDFHLCFDNIQEALRDPARYTINGGAYLLVEFPDHSIAGMDRVLATFIDRGLTPIITHPERNARLRDIPAEFQKWIAQGCLVQITAQSLSGRFGTLSSQSAWEMLRRGLAHFIASDAHDYRDRTPRLDIAYAAVAARLGESTAQRLLQENPAAVVAGIPIDAMPVRRGSWFGWGRR